MLEVQRGFLGLMVVGGEAHQEVDHEVVGAAMAGMLDLADALEAIFDTLDDRPLAQQQLVVRGKIPRKASLLHCRHTTPSLNPRSATHDVTISTSKDLH